MVKKFLSPVATETETREEVDKVSIVHQTKLILK